MLRRFWFEFEFKEDEIAPGGLGYGCGVTAFDLSDAMSLLQARVFRERPIPQVRDLVEDVDVSTLDPGHVLPNMTPPNIRGVWFPLGYDR